METIKTNQQSQGADKKLVFLNINRFFWSNKGKLILVLDGGTAVAVHPNFFNLIRPSNGFRGQSSSDAVTRSQS